MKIKLNPRNNYIIMDLLMRKLVILKVRLMRLKSGQPLQAPVLPLSYLLEERADHLADKIDPAPEWFEKIKLDLWNFKCYDYIEEPSKGMLDREKQIEQIQKELDDFSNSEGNLKDIIY